MNRLTLLLSLLTAFATMSCVAAVQPQASSSPNEIIQAPGDGPTVSPVGSQLSARLGSNPASTRVTMEIEAAGPITISKDQVEKADRYESYLKELKEWQLEAIRVAERLEKEGKLFTPDEQKLNDIEGIGIMVPYKGSGISLIRSWRSRVQARPSSVIPFPKSVIDEMRPAPAGVGRPSPTEAALHLKFTNVSSETVCLNGDVYCDACKIQLSVSGDRVFNIPITSYWQTADYRTGSVVKLEPGENYVIKLKRLKFGDRGVKGICLRSAGKHRVAITYSGQCPFAGPRNSGVACAATTDVEVILKEE